MFRDWLLIRHLLYRLRFCRCQKSTPAKYPENKRHPDRSGFLHSMLDYSHVVKDLPHFKVDSDAIHILESPSDFRRVLSVMQT